MSFSQFILNESGRTDKFPTIKALVMEKYNAIADVDLDDIKEVARLLIKIFTDWRK